MTAENSTFTHRSCALKTAMCRMAEVVEANRKVSQTAIEAIQKVSLAMQQLSPEVLIRAIDASTILLVELTDDHDPPILFISATLEQAVFGYFPGELRGKPLSHLIPNAMRDAHRRHFAGFTQSPKNRQMGDNGGRLEGVKADGTTFAVEVLIQVFGEDGKRYAVANVNPNRLLNKTGMTESGVLKLKRDVAELSARSDKIDKESIHE